LNKNIVIVDNIAASVHATSPYFTFNPHVLSVLCIPIIFADDKVSVLYLESNEGKYNTVMISGRYPSYSPVDINTRQLA